MFASNDLTDERERASCECATPVPSPSRVRSTSLRAWRRELSCLLPREFRPRVHVLRFVRASSSMSYGVNPSQDEACVSSGHLSTWSTMSSSGCRSDESSSRNIFCSPCGFHLRGGVCSNWWCSYQRISGLEWLTFAALNAGEHFAGAPRHWPCIHGLVMAEHG